MTKKKKKHKNKNKAVKPDEIFAQGPIRVARFGSNVLFQTDLTAEAHAEMLAGLADRYPKIVQEIDGLVDSIAKLVSELAPDQLLHRAWWSFASRALTSGSEGNFDAIDLRMIDYIQSVIVSVKPAQPQRDAVTDQEWATLKAWVEKLFREVNLTYQLCRAAKAKVEDPDFDEEAEEFFFRAQLYWSNVRGARHQVHQIVHLRDLLLPHSAVFEELFGLTAEQFVDELAKLWHSLTFGVPEAYQELDSFRKESLSALESELELEAEHSRDPADLPTLMQKVIADRGWQERQKRVMGRCLGLDLCDVRAVTALSQSLVDELTWSPGEETDFLAAGEFKGWPLRIWPTFRRPFIRLGDRAYCFDLHGLFDNIYRVMQRIIVRLKPSYRDTWNRIQQSQSEELPFKYLTQMLPGATVYRSVYYRWHPQVGATERSWCEADGLLILDDHLFIIEVRAGAFTYTSPANDFPAFVSSLKNLVLKPATQGKRFLDYLGSEETVSIFDRDHNKIFDLRKADYRQITSCPVTLDPFTEMAAQVQHLRKIGVDVGDHPVWVLSLDDLRTYADIFEDSLWFLHYVEQRMRAFKSDLVQADDEFDHLGLYFKHNNYSLRAEQMRGTSDARITFGGYRSEIDKFFAERLRDPSAPCPLRQDTPPRISEIVSFLSGGAKRGRAELASYLLDLDGVTRQQVSDHIDLELAGQPVSRRPKPFSTHGGVDLTVFCYTPSWAPRVPAAALDHARAVMLVNAEERRLLLELSYSDEGVLSDVAWQWVERARIPLQDLARLQRHAGELRDLRLAKARADRGKIGRNERCPCGSGRKYKFCCI